MHKNPSRLSFLMDSIGVTGRELANALHVDYSLVSKWKNNQRPLSLRSIHLRNISAYFLLKEKAAGGSFLRDLLKEYHSTLNTDSEAELSACLCNWLTESRPLQRNTSLLFCNNLNGNYTAEFNVYKGNEGRRTAVHQFLDYALTLPGGQKLLMVSQEDMSWMIEDPLFFNTSRQKLEEIIHKNHKLQIIHWVDRSLEDLGAIINQWLPMHLTGRLDAWFYPKYFDYPLKMTLFIIQNHMAITGMAVKAPAENRYTFLHSDPGTVQQCELTFQTLLLECLRLVDIYSMKNIETMIKKLSNEPFRGSSYLVSSLPLFFTMSQNLLAGLLADNNVDTPATKRCLQIHQQLNAICNNNGSNHPRRHIYNIDALEQSAYSGVFSYPELSGLSGVDIRVSREFFHKHIELLVSYLENSDNFRIALVPSKQIFNKPVNLWLNQDSCVIAWSPAYSPLVTMSGEPTIVNAFYFHYENIWELIPRINRNRDWVIARLLKLIV